MRRVDDFFQAWPQLSHSTAHQQAHLLRGRNTNGVIRLEVNLKALETSLHSDIIRSWKHGSVQLAVTLVFIK